MKQGWEIKKLGEIADVEYGFTDKSTEEGDYRYVRITDIDNNGELISTEKKYLKRSKEAEGFLISDNDLLMARTGATFAKVLLYEDIEPSVFASYLIRIKSKEKIENKLYWYFTKTKSYWDQANSLASGAAQPHFNGAAVKQVKFSYPKSLPEQHRIVAILDEAFAAIAKAKANAQQNLQNAKELFESYLQGVFEKKGDDWVQTSLKNEIDLATGFAFKSKHYTNNDGDILLLRGDNIMQGDFRWKDAKRWDKSEYKDFEKYQLQENDIVLAMDRPWVKAGLKYARVSKSELPSLLVQRTARLRNKPQLDNSFLYYLIQSKGFTDYLIDIQTGIGVPHISGNQIFGFTFRKPDLKEQQQIVKKLNSLSTETKKLEGIYQQKINDLEELKKSVLNKAFSGGLN